MVSSSQFTWAYLFYLTLLDSYSTKQQSLRLTRRASDAAIGFAMCIAGLRPSTLHSLPHPTTIVSPYPYPTTIVSPTPPTYSLPFNGLSLLPHHHHIPFPYPTTIAAPSFRPV